VLLCVVQKVFGHVVIFCCWPSPYMGNRTVPRYANNSIIWQSTREANGMVRKVCKCHQQPLNKPPRNNTCTLKKKHPFKASSSRCINTITFKSSNRSFLSCFWIQQPAAVHPQSAKWSKAITKYKCKLKWITLGFLHITARATELRNANGAENFIARNAAVKTKCLRFPCSDEYKQTVS